MSNDTPIIQPEKQTFAELLQSTYSSSLEAHKEAVTLFINVTNKERWFKEAQEKAAMVIYLEGAAKLHGIELVNPATTFSGDDEQTNTVGG